MSGTALILNTHNEGPDVARTIESFRAAAGGEPVHAVVVADGTTDGSCDALPPDTTLVRVHGEPVGCGRAKALALAWLPEAVDVVWHNDAHNRLLTGTVADFARLCREHPDSLVTPAVGPLRCIHRDGNTCRAGQRFPEACDSACPRITDNTAVPDNCYMGGRLTMNHDGPGVSLTLDRPAEPITETGAVNYSSFGYHRDALARFGGFWRFPGRWGLQEAGLSLRAFFTATPIRLARDLTVLHRYRSWNHPEGRAVAPYPIEDWSKAANARYLARAAFDPLTWDRFWTRFFERQGEAPAEHAHATDATHRVTVTRDTETLHDADAHFGDVAADAQAFARLKRRTDPDFWDHIGHPDPVTWHVAPDATRGLFVGAGGIGNILLTVPAMKSLAEQTGRPIDLDLRDAHRPVVAEVLRDQPWVAQVYTGKDAAIDYTRYVRVAAGWRMGLRSIRTAHGDDSPIFPRGLRVGHPDSTWRTWHETEIALDAVEHDYARAAVPSAGLQIDEPLPEALADIRGEYVALCPDTAGQPWKRYPHWPTVAQRLADAGLPVVLVGTDPAPAAGCEAFARSMIGQTTYRQAAAVLRDARLAVTVDSGHSHLAAAVGTPVLALYGPTAERSNRPWTEACDLLRSPLSCAPCWSKKPKFPCGAGERKQPAACMAAIDPERVAGAVLQTCRQPAWNVATSEQHYLTRRQRVLNTGGVVSQSCWEMSRAMDLLRPLRPRRVLEIGTECGGWMHVAAGICQPGAELVAVDPRPKPVWHINADALRREGFRVRLLESTSDAAVAELRDQAPFDLLHIDGVHTGDQPWRDWTNYSPLVRPGGAVIFHDAMAGRNTDGYRTVFQAVQRIRLEGHHRVIEIGEARDLDKDHMWLAVVWIPPRDWSAR